MIAETLDGPLYYETSGHGQPLVFCSGWAMSCECWRPAIALLQQEYRCVIYDARGVGRSQPASGRAGFTIQEHADDLHAIIEAASAYDAAIVGHEAGALVAADCATRHPQDLRALALVSPRGALSEPELKRFAVYTPAALALRELASFPLIRNIVTRRFRRAPQPFRDQLFEDFAELSPRAAYQTAVSASMDEPLSTLETFVRRARVPLLIACGQKDKKGLAQGRRLFSLAQAGKLAVIRDAGFLPMLEYPEQFARLIDAFVGRAGTSSVGRLARGNHRR